jgi:nitrogenase-associated protein
VATIVFYEKPGCGNNTRQKVMLAAAGHTVLAKSLLTEPWTRQRLREFFGIKPVAEWFNPAAPRIKSGEIVPESMEAETALALMLQDPLLIRRPLMEADGRKEAGFDPEFVDRWLGLKPGPHPEDLESCPRSHNAAPCPVPEQQG